MACKFALKIVSSKKQGNFPKQAGIKIQKSSFWAMALRHSKGEKARRVTLSVESMSGSMLSHALPPGFQSNQADEWRIR